MATEKTVDNINELLGSWDHHRDKYINNSVDISKSLIHHITEIYTLNFDVLEFDKFVMWHNDYLCDKERNNKDGHNFSIFDLLKQHCNFHVQETMHSKLMRFLLDRHETHGQGNIFLLEFLKMLGMESPEIGIWHITTEVDKIDILIRRDNPRSVVIIENKSNRAPDQPNQLYRYWHKAIYSRTKEIGTNFYDNNAYRYQVVYLTPNVHKQCEAQSLAKPSDYPDDLPEMMPIKIKTITFDNQIQDWLEKCKSLLPDTNHRVREYISQYQALCKIL